MNNIHQARFNPLFSMLQPYKYNPFRSELMEQNKLIRVNSKPEKNSVGRPTVMTQEVIGKLKYAYLTDASDAEACFYSGISTDCLYKYQRENPEFIKLKAQWKANPVLKAKDTVLKSIKLGDVSTAKWLLEKLEPKEYGNKLQVDHDHIHKLDDYQLEQLEQQIMDQIAAAAGYIKLDDTQLIDVTPSE